MAEIFTTAVGILVAADIAAEEVVKAIPFVGWILTAINSAADVAALVETTVEVAKSPATMSVLYESQMDIAVTVKHDPNDHEGWPGEATVYQLSITYRDGTSRVMDGKVPAGKKISR
ncbi:MAG: hypothetical protein O7E53_02640 [Alphaproteobacteria bacterium]|nr:hypothetical protein [Alphaproteobacteria bacterium]